MLMPPQRSDRLLLGCCFLIVGSTLLVATPLLMMAEGPAWPDGPIVGAYPAWVPLVAGGVGLVLCGAGIRWFARYLKS